MAGPLGAPEGAVAGGPPQLNAITLGSITRIEAIVVPPRVALFVLLLAAACTRDRWDTTARRELLRRGRLDQAIRDTFASSFRDSGRPDSEVAVRMLVLDSANAAWLKSQVASRGWPLGAVVGHQAAEAAFLIVQHATHDSAFQGHVLRLVEPLAAAGEVGGQEYAMLSDRVAVHAGRPQLYGTQAEIRDGRVILDPIVDSVGVDARRARLGLPSLAVYVRILDSVYAHHPRP